METETDKSCNDSKTLQDYMRHVEQQSHGRTTHTHKQLTLIFRYLKTIILFAFDRVWILVVCMSFILRRLNATTKTHATNARALETYAVACTKPKNSDRKVLVRQLWKGLYEITLDRYDILLWVFVLLLQKAYSLFKNLKLMVHAVSYAKTERN